MATITMYLSTKIDKQTNKSEILFRFVGALKGCTFRIKSGIFIDGSKFWNEAKTEKATDRNGNEYLKTISTAGLKTPKQVRIGDNQKELKAITDQVTDLQKLLIDEFNAANKSVVDKTFLETIVDKYHHPEKYELKQDKPQILFFDVFDLFVAEMGKLNEWTKATYQKFAALKNHLYYFDKNITFEKLTKDKLSDFVYFMQDVLDFRNSTIGKQIGFFKWFMRWATANGYNKKQAFLSFAPKLKMPTEKQVIFLDWEELMQVYNYDFSNDKRLAQVRDVFCFCCFTSLRYSDVANLKRSSINKDYIEVVTIKTNDRLKIELNDYSRAILNKYKRCKFDNDLALPIITNQKMNDYLKEMGEICGLDKPITITYYKGKERHDETLPKYKLLGTHTARRTFICNALAFGIAPQVVMKWTGHSDYDSMRPYIAVADKTKAEAMKLFNK